jgi:plastocyanin
MTDPMNRPSTDTRQGGDGLRMVTPIIALAALAIALFSLIQGSGSVQVPADTDPMTREFALSSDLVNGSNRYHPDTLVAFTGDDIAFNVTNRGEGEHGFTVTGTDISDVIPEGESREYTASDLEPGVYEYFCQLHAGHIRGQLIVLGR